MKEHSMNNHIIEGAVFAYNILKFNLITLLFGIGLISYIKGIPYPIMPVAIVIIAYYAVSQISIITIKKNFDPSRIYLVGAYRNPA